MTVSVDGEPWRPSSSKCVPISPFSNFHTDTSSQLGAVAGREACRPLTRNSDARARRLTFMLTLCANVCPSQQVRNFALKPHPLRVLMGNKSYNITSAPAPAPLFHVCVCWLRRSCCQVARCRNQCIWRRISSSTRSCRCLRRHGGPNRRTTRPCRP